MSNTDELRAALRAAREARDAIPLGAERSVLNVALDRLDVALSAAVALAQQPAAYPDECAANGNGHNFGPHGPGAAMQCAWCGESQQAAASGEPTPARAGPPGSPSDPEICNERSAQVSGPVYCGDSGGYCSACPKRVAAPAPLPVCKGMNCGATDGRSHSLECHAEHAAAIAGGQFVKAASGEPVAPFGYVITNNVPESSPYRYLFYPPEQINSAYKDNALHCTPVYTAPQPAHAPAVPPELDVRRIMIGIVPGDGSGHEVYAKTVADVEDLLTTMSERIEDLESPAQPAPAPQFLHATCAATAADHAARGTTVAGGRPQPAPAPAVSGEPVAIAKIDLGFRWDSERLHHVPQLLIEFAAVPMNGPNDAKGWRDRDTLAAQIGAPQPAPALVPLTEQKVWNNDAIMSRNAVGGLPMPDLMRLVRAIEAAHGIGTPAKEASNG